jgi:hypothetical protein
MGSIRQCAGSTQNHKKKIETPNQPIETKKLLKKSMLRTLKVVRSSILRDEICRLNSKS